MKLILRVFTLVLIPFLLISSPFVSSCSWIQSKRNEEVFESEEYKSEEVLAFSQLLEQVTDPLQSYSNKKSLRFLFFLRTDTLYGWEIDHEDGDYLFGKLKSRRLNLNEFEKFENLRVLTVPDGITKTEDREQEKIYWEYRKEFLTTSEVFNLSRIAFNKEFTKGLMRYNYSCGSLCYESCTLFIKKVNGKWVIEKKESCIVA